MMKFNSNPKKNKILILIFLQFITLSVYAQWIQKDTVELQIRDGLPNFFNKLKSGKKTTVGFLGGSITEATGWRNSIVDWMKASYQNENFVDYNAGIGGTNSKFGVFRIDRHLLTKDTFDLIFIEFAVNDLMGENSDVEKSIEGIVRKIRNKNPKTDICFVYSVAVFFLDDIQKGKMNLSASKHDSIASYYKIPSVFFGVSYDKLCKTDSVVFQDKVEDQLLSTNEAGKRVLTVDGVHPTRFGHEVYFNVLRKLFLQMQNNSENVAHELKLPLVEGNYVDAGMQYVDNKFNTGMQYINQVGQRPYLDQFITNASGFLVSGNSENFYSFSFTGSEMGLSMIFGPRGGKFYIDVDGEAYEYNTFDAYSTYERMNYFFRPLDYGKHNVKIFPSPNKLTLEEKAQILDSDSKRAELYNNPSIYSINEIAFSDIFIIGNIDNDETITANIDTNKFFTFTCTGNQLSIKLNELPEGQISIYNSTGQLINSKLIYPGFQVNFLIQVNDVYLITCRYMDMLISKKFLF